MSTDPDFAAWVDRARAVRLEVECDRRMLKLSRGHERAGPCPICRDGRDRFAVNIRKQVWTCRKCGTGGDVIKLVMMVDGVDFVQACEMLAGEPPPRGRAMTAAERAAIDAEHRRKEGEAAQARLEADRKQAMFRERERRQLYEIWRRLLVLAGSPVAAYLAHRGVPMVPPTAAIRYWPDAPYFHGQAIDEVGRSRPKLIHTGPAMVAAITGPDGRFQGLHTTPLAGDPPRKFSPGLDEDGEPLPAKKVRGAKSGNRIVLRHAPQMRRLFVGEGIETVLSVWWALSQTGRLTPADGFWSSVDLGNLGGRAIGRVEHPTARIVDSKGRSRPLLVPDAAPDLDSKAIVVPEGVEEVFLLGDGDSDRFATELTLLRAARRTSLTCSTVKAVRLAWADDGADFNDMLEAA